ncbi:MAG: hypothetical protein D6806_14370 [Deltaproteobacteria bacterium]|nr:MAG: hypothetical protein D6806_14370 [Deltaproteobacteria bacterium]
MNPRQVIEKALELEKSGFDFYTKAKEWAKNPEAAKLFGQLAEEESHHTAFLQREKESLEKSGGWTEIPELKSSEPSGTGPVFPQGKSAPRQVGQDSTEEDVLLFALDIEARSYELYRKAAEEAVDEAGRRFLMRIAGAEQAHFDAIMNIYESRFGYPR